MTMINILQVTLWVRCIYSPYKKYVLRFFILSHLFFHGLHLSSVQRLSKSVKYKKKMVITLMAAAPEAQYFFKIFFFLCSLSFFPFCYSILPGQISILIFPLDLLSSSTKSLDNNFCNIFRSPFSLPNLFDTIVVYKLRTMRFYNIRLFNSTLKD